MDVPHRLFRFFCVVLLLVAVAPVARAADPVAQVTALNKKAIEAYNKQDYDTAQSLLKQALDVCNAAALDKHPIKARTHIHLGILSIVGFNQKERGLKHFRKALEIQPDIKLTKSLSTPELEQDFESAMAAGGDSGGEAAPAAEGGGASGDTEGGGGAPSVASDGDEDTPRVRRRPPPKKKKKSEDEDEDEDEGEGPSYKIFIGVALGSGAGIASGSGELNPAHQLTQAGFAPAQAGHISPEIGFFFNPRLMLSARARLQYVSGLNGEAPPAGTTGCGSDNFCSPATGAFAAFLRASYFLGGGSLRWMVAGEAGGGNIRHAHVFTDDKRCSTAANGQLAECVDTLASGPIFVGGAAGFLWDFSDVAGLIANVTLDLGFSKFTANLDLNLGVAMHF